MLFSVTSFSNSLTHDSLIEISLLIFSISFFWFSICFDRRLEFFVNESIGSLNMISRVRSEILDPKSKERELAYGSNSSPAMVTLLYPCFDNLYAVDRKSTRLNSSHRTISYAVFCLKKKNKKI